MTSVELVLAIVKILIVVMFLLNMAAIATWADRRQGAMVQDRVGPNRAVVYLPSLVVRGIVFFPPALLAALSVFTATRPASAPAAAETMVAAAQFAVAVAWLRLIVFCASARRRPVQPGRGGARPLEPSASSTTASWPTSLVFVYAGDPALGGARRRRGSRACCSARSSSRAPTRPWRVPEGKIAAAAPRHAPRRGSTRSR